MEENKFKVKSTPAFKLKDRNGRDVQFIDLKKQFGFIPDVICIQKVKGSNNGMMVHAVLTEAELKKQESIEATMIKKEEAI
jgi:hypothetical protein